MKKIGLNKKERTMKMKQMMDAVVAAAIMGLMATSAKAALPEKFRWDDVDGECYTTPVKTQTGSTDRSYAYAMMDLAETYHLVVEKSKGKKGYYSRPENERASLHGLVDELAADAMLRHDAFTYREGSAKAPSALKTLDWMIRHGLNGKKVTHFYLFPTITTKDTSSDAWKREINGIKDHLCHAPIASGYQYIDSFLNNGRYYYLPKYPSEFDTDVKNYRTALVIGYDDTVPASAFASGGEVPDGDGAWIVKGSYGEGFGDAGYFYISYYDNNIFRYVFADASSQYTVGYLADYSYFTFIDEDNGYGRVYCHCADINSDGTGSHQAFVNDDHYSCASMFTAGQDDEIKAIGVFTLSEWDAKVHVFRGCDEGNPVSGEHVLDCERLDVPAIGYHGLNLPAPISVKKGQRFSIVLEQCGGLALVRSSSPVRGQCFKGYGKYTTPVTDIEWEDMSEHTSYDANGCLIAAYTTNESDLIVDAGTVDGIKLLADTTVGEEPFWEELSENGIIDRSLRRKKGDKVVVNGENTVVKVAPAPDANEIEIAVTSSGEWVAHSAVSWISVQPGNGPKGMTKATLSIGENDTGAVRIGEVRFVCGKIERILRIVQDRYRIYLSRTAAVKDYKSTQTYFMTWRGGWINDLWVTANGRWGSETEFKDSIWLTPTTGMPFMHTPERVAVAFARDADTSLMTVNFTNKTASATLEILLSPPHLSELQVQEGHWLRVAPSVIDISPFGVNGNGISVDSCSTWSIASYPEWFDFVRMDDPVCMGEGKVSFSVPRNTSGEIRTGVILFTNEHGKEATVSVSQPSVPEPGGSGIEPPTPPINLSVYDDTNVYYVVGYRFEDVIPGFTINGLTNNATFYTNDELKVTLFVRGGFNWDQMSLCAGASMRLTLDGVRAYEKIMDLTDWEDAYYSWQKFVVWEDEAIEMLQGLEPGSHTLCIELNANHIAPESNYEDNFRTLEFVIKDDRPQMGDWEFPEGDGGGDPPDDDPVDTFTAAGLEPSYTLQGGAAPDLSKVFATVAGDGWKIAASGLPAGLKFAQDKKTGDYTLTGVATKAVTSDVTFTATKGTEKEVAKSTFEVVFPTLAVVAEAYGDPAATNGAKVVGGGKYALGAKVTLKATPAKTSVFMGWFKGGELVSQNASYAYVTTAEDVTFAAKFVTKGEDEKAISLTVNGVAIGSSETPVSTNVVCGVALEWPVAADALSATTVKVSGLPAGLKFADKPVTSKIGSGKSAVTVTNVPANTIYGAPSAASKTTTDKKTGAVTVTPSDVKITVTTAGKSSVTYLVKLTVDPLPAWAVGNFEGVAGSGSATMSVAASGKVSGKVALGGTNWTFKADSFAITSETVGDTNFVLNLPAASGKATSDLALTLSALPTEDLPRSATALADGTFGEDAAKLWRLPWADKSDADAAKLAATLAGAYSCKATYGDSTCNVTFTLDEKGAIKGSVVAPDGTKTRKASFSANALPKADGIYTAIVLPPDAKKGYPAVFEVVELIGQAGAPKAGVAYRDPGVVATAQAYSDPAASGTVSVSPKYGQVAAGKDVTLAAKADKGSVFYRWEVTGIDTTGLDLSSATLKFKSPGTNDVVATAVFVKDTEDAESVGLAVGGVDLFSAPAETPTWSNFCGVAVNWDVEATALSATTVKATGLPSGLKLVQDKKTKAYTVAGVPAAASKTDKSGNVTPSPVKFTVTTAGKSSKDFTVNLVVLPLPAWAVGTFDGAVEGGVVQALTIDAKGKIRGKILKNGESWALSAASFDAYDADGEAFHATVIGKAGKEVATYEVTVAAAENGAGVAASEGWTAYQNLWKRADTKAEQPVFKKNIDAEDGDADNKLTFTFKKDGAVSVAGKVGGAKVSASSQLVDDGTGWCVTVYAPKTKTFEGFCETYSVTLKTDEKNVVTDVTVETASAVAPLWAVGEYVGYGNVYKPNKTGLDEYLYGMLYVDVAEDLTFTGRFEPVDSSGSCPFSGKFTPFGGGGAPGYQADRVTITVKGVQMSIGFSMIYKPYADKEQGYGEIFGWSNYVSEDEERFCPTRVWQNVWKQENLAEERPTFAEGTVLTIEPQYEAGDSLNFAFSTDGTSIDVTGQVNGTSVGTTATIGVETQSEGKCECYLYFMTDGHVYSLSFTIPSSGVVTKDDIILDGDLDDYFGMVNAW